MTLEQLLELSASDLEKLSDADILKFAEENNWLKFTRPELADKPDRASTTRKINNFEHNARIGKAKAFAEKWGLGDIGDLFD